mmetsp:Transcript_26792/g.28839  ORF Transcript_26792/g.28839 Transcript_26792/m.28839 type:complete len:199 (+) Transcript_26792:189-785(+)
MKEKSNKKVGLHNDINFDDDGNQKKNDTADGSHPIATYNVGATRQLKFKWMMKDNDVEKPTWEKVKIKDKENTDKFIDDCRVFDLSDGSIMILIPIDESPIRMNRNTLYKTKHQGELSDTGISLGFVFRRVKTTSLFNKETNVWEWEEDPAYNECGRKASSGLRNRRIENYRKRNKVGIEDVGLLAVIKNVKEYLEKL